jgi:hypothetical protein
MKNNLKDITYQSVRGYLVILFVGFSLVLALFTGVSVTQKKFSNWIVTNYTEPFLK